MTEQMEEFEPQEAVEAEAAVDQDDVERETEQVSEWAPEDEEAARALGWVPRDEWKGEAKRGFIEDPRAFLDRAETFGPFRKLRERAEAIERQLEEQREHVRKIESLTAKQVERAQKQAEAEYQRRLDAISAQKRKAAEEGDLEAYDKWSAAERQVRPPEPETVEPVAPQVQDPITPDLKERHQWIADPFLRQQGAMLVDQGLASGELTQNSTAEQQAEYAATRLKSYFPHIFAPKREAPKPSPVESGGVAAPARGGFGSLPKDAKDAFKRLVAQGVFKDTDADRKFYYDEYSTS